MVNIVKAEELTKLIKKNTIVVLDIFTTWCYPCRKIAESMEKLEKIYKDQADIVFVKLDAEDNVSWSKANKISAVPTVMAWYKGQAIHFPYPDNKKKTIDRIEGAIDGFQKVIKTTLNGLLA